MKYLLLTLILLFSTNSNAATSSTTVGSLMIRDGDSTKMISLYVDKKGEQLTGSIVTIGAYGVSSIVISNISTQDMKKLRDLIDTTLTEMENKKTP